MNNAMQDMYWVMLEDGTVKEVISTKNGQKGINRVLDTIAQNPFKFLNRLSVRITFIPMVKSVRPGCEYTVDESMATGWMTQHYQVCPGKWEVTV